MRLLAAAVVGLAAACGGGATRVGTTPAAPSGDRQIALTLYRDAALVHERWRVPLHGGTGTIEVPVDTGISVEDLAVLGTRDGRLLGLALRAPGPRPGDAVTVAGASGELVLDDCAAKPTDDAPVPPTCGRGVAVRAADQTLHVVDAGGVVEYRGDDGGGAHAAISVEGSGDAAWIELTYTTPRIAWSAAYALIRDATGNRATLDGAVAIDNRSGVEFPAAAVVVVDDELIAARTRAANELGKELISGEPGKPSSGRSLGVVDVERGESRLVLVVAPQPLALEEVLVFDPIGTRFDAAGRVPQKSPDYGLEGKPVTTVLRSFEIALDARTRGGLPAGPVRLFGRGDHGELVPLGGGRMFDRAQGDAKTATVPVGRSPDVTARRQRTEFVLDDDKQRLIEEFTITIKNAGAHPVQVLVREHMYRGENWTMPYSSVHMTKDDNKEGPQQIAMRVQVPAHGETRVVYRVGYHW